MERNLRIHREAIRETIRQLRAWSARWEETRGQAQRAAQALVDAAQAAPARAFEAATARTLHQLQQSGERIRLLADILEQALHHLEEAFLQAAQPLAEGWIAPLQLPVTPLAVEASGTPIPNQFMVQFPTPQGPIPWATACGPVALSMALSRLTRRPIPAQEVANRLVEITGKAPEVEGGRATALTTTWDLIATANAYGIHGERVSLRGSSSEEAEEAWHELQGLMRQPIAVMALVTAKGSTTSATRGNADWESYGLKAPDIVVSEEDRRKGDGGILTGSSGRRKKPGEIAHWVVIDRLEERDGKRYVVINNPYHNRQEHYPWEYFWNSVNYQARGKNRWWVLSLETQLSIPEGNAVTHP